ncbi:hypothetical protein I5G87_gp77 [Mycobacterium phage Ekdilam]|uniref:Uncharacterized protein n=1 Tax=Mycobacterium phage Ekdilam TaxID=2599862 RepID=A0A5J6TKZ2_9CAUD|nr:hypothetical protein I5G87_gp77 [Mycobacterium phage Ekdilam]QFG11501.1 hypothetical protein PBI_EKDILAM_77 [Mycobacterium phage Ekdilam]
MSADQIGAAVWFVVIALVGGWVLWQIGVGPPC